MKKLDIFIIKKFLGTFFLALLLIIVIVIIFDVSEKIDDFIEKEAPIKEIVFTYYLNFIPYFANLFLSLFTFIAVIFFTSKLTSNSELIAILSSGISYKRFLRPYIISATLIFIVSFFLINWIIPPANKNRLEFEETYIRNAFKNSNKNIHRQIAKGTFVYMESFNSRTNTAYKFSIEKILNGKLSSKLISNQAQWDSLNNKWKITDYSIRKIKNNEETLSYGEKLDSTINMHPNDFTKRNNTVEAMNYSQLNDFISEEIMVGSNNVTLWKTEKHKRLAYPFSTIILTVIGVCISSQKTRGGIGLNIGIGIFLAFSYIMFMQVSSVLAINVNINPLFAIWIPNLLYSIIGLGLFIKAAK
ncbi:MAG: LptF/LptG family permease [Salinivirgaceae bacterium]|nr:LptF/LptG family permease [Salinivirgaceae bacterium]